MLYSIIPPILVVLSVIGVILLLMRKVPEINRIEEQERFNNRIARERGGVIFSKAEVENTGGSKIVNFMSFIFLALGKIVKLFQGALSSLQNVFKSWGDAIQKKRGLRQNNEEKMIEIKHVFKEDEKPVRPFVSEKVAKPVVDDERRKEIKERLEEILIERIASNPKDMEAYERLGEYYMEIGNLDHSKECFKQVIKLDPGNRSVKYKIRKLERLLKV